MGQQNVEKNVSAMVFTKELCLISLLTTLDSRVKVLSKIPISEYICLQNFFPGYWGKKVLIDKAVKAADIEYIQRPLIKAMEDNDVCYIGTVGHSASRTVKFLYGENGMNAIFLEDLIRCFARLN